MAGDRSSKTSPRRVNVALRRAKALEMRAAGAKYEEIRQALGYSSRGAATQDVQRALAATVREVADEVRQLELMRLDQMWVEVLKVLRRQHVTVSNGRVVTLDDQPIEDDGPVLQAIDRLLRIQERRAKLLGLDAPKQVEVITGDLIDREIQRLEQELEQRERELDSADADEVEAAEGAATAES